ncbi:MAG: hypothetical protein ABIK28_21545 [Planctomycetota bacterium]
MSVLIRTALIRGLALVLFFSTVCGLMAAQEQDKASDESKSTVTKRLDIGQSEQGQAPGLKLSQTPGAQGKDDAPVAAKIDDIKAHRRTPLPFITHYEDRVVLDLDKVDYDADVVAVIDGEPINQQLFKAYLTLFVGGLEVDRFITAVVTKIGIEGRLEEGADPSEFQVSEERIDQEIERQIDFQKQQKNEEMADFDMETWKKNIDATYGWERYRDLVRAVVGFEKVYLPPIPEKPAKEESAAPEGGAAEENKEGETATASEPAEVVEELDPNLPMGTDAKGIEVNIYMPIITWNAMSQSDRARGLRDHINKLYKDGQPLGDFLRPHFARSIKEAILQTYDIEFFYTGKLPENVFARVQGRDIMLDDIYAVTELRITPDDQLLALREILVCKAMDSALKKANCFLTDEEFKQAFRAHEKEYEGGIFPLEFIIRLHGYYNKNRYKNIYRRRAGFERLIAGELGNDELLKEFYEGAARMLYENASAKLQIIFFGVYDTKEKKYRENGWEWAKEQMDGVMAALDAGEDFGSLVKKYEDPTGTFTTFDFELLGRNQLRMALADSSKSALITGYSLADYAFYCADTNEIIGPVMKRWSDLGNPVHKGLYLARVTEFRRSQYLKPYDQAKAMVVTDYADLKFTYWAQQCLRDADIELTLKK